MFTFRALVFISWVAVLVPEAGFAEQARPNVYLGEAKVLYQSLEYEKALERLRQAAMLSQNSRRQAAEIELYSGLCRFILGQMDDARAHFRVGLALDPKLELPVGTSPKIIAEFSAQKSKVLAEAASSAEPSSVDVPFSESAAASPAPPALTLAPRPSESAGPLAPRAELTTAPSHSRVIPLVLLGSALAASGAGTYWGLSAKSYERRANDLSIGDLEAERFGQSAKSRARSANVAFGIAAAAAISGVVGYAFDW